MIDAILQFIQDHRSEIFAAAIGFLSLALPLFYAMWKERKSAEIPEAGEVAAPYRSYYQFRRDVMDPYTEIEDILERCNGAVPSKPIPDTRLCPACNHLAKERREAITAWMKRNPKNCA